MKKIILGLGIAIATLFSCSSDDASSDSGITKDQITGVYNLVFESENGEVEALDPCRKKTALEITDTVFKQLYFTGNDTDNCGNGGLITGSYTIQNSSLSAKTNDGDFEIEVTFEEDLLVFTYTVENNEFDVEKWKKTTEDFPTIEEKEEVVAPMFSIVGEWQLISILDKDGKEDIQECEKLNTLTFQDNGDLVSLFHDINDSMNCIEETTTITYTVDGNTIITNNSDNSETKTQEFAYNTESNELSLVGDDSYIEIYTRK